MAIARCAEEVPQLTAAKGGGLVACHRAFETDAVAAMPAPQAGASRLTAP
jgi:hypothetical protein